MGKIFQCIQKKLGRSAISATFSVESFTNKCIGMVNVHDIVYESRHSTGARFLKQFGNLQEHKIPKTSRLCSTIIQKLKKKSILKKFWMWETLDYSITLMDKINTVQRQHRSSRWRQNFLSTQIQFYVLVKLEHNHREPPMQNGQDKLKISKGIPHTKTQLVLMEKKVPRKSRTTQRGFYHGRWTFLGPGSEKKWHGCSYDGQCDRTANNMVQQFQRNWSSYFHSHQCFESRNVETKKRQKYHSLQWILHEHRTIISNK